VNRCGRRSCVQAGRNDRAGPAPICSLQAWRLKKASKF
jgi:hypothetical protein